MPQAQGPTLNGSPVTPLLKNQDDPTTLKRAVDKRTKRVPVPRVTATRVASGKSRSLSDRLAHR